MTIQVVVLDNVGECPSELLGYLSDAEHARYDTITDQQTRWNFAAGRVLLRAALRAFYPRVDADLTIDRHGKPRLRDGSVDFNLTHSVDTVALILTTAGACGIDIESCDRVVDHAGLAERVFTATERRWIAEGSCARRFFALWTLKEAYMKAIGLGFRLNPQSFEFAMNGVSLGIRADRLAADAWNFGVFGLGQWCVAFAVQHESPTRTGVRLRRCNAGQFFRSAALDWPPTQWV